MIIQTQNNSLLGIVLGGIGLLFLALAVAAVAMYRTVASASHSPRTEHHAEMLAPAEAVVHRTAEPAPPPPPRYPPGYNFALAAHGAKISGGVNAAALIDGIDIGYTGGSGYAYTIWSTQPPPPMLIELKEPSEIDCVRFLLWDLDERFYRYKLEIGTASPTPTWTLVCDKTANTDECRGWQLVKFPKQSVQLIRLTGTYNSSNSQFHAVELQALIAPPNGFPGKSIPQQIDPNTPRENLEF